MKSKELSRRDFLRLSVLTAATAAGAAALAGCGSPPAQPPAEEGESAAVEEAVAKATVEPAAPVAEAPEAAEGTVTIMHDRKELTEEQEAQFEADHPGIQIDFVEQDVTRFIADYAAGNPADLVRVQAPSIPQFLARGLLYDLTAYFEASDLLSLDDLAPANKYYMATSPFEIGSGPIYGICKDWSPDFTIYVYTKAFDDAGVDVPDPETPLTYQEVLDLARQVAQFEGDRTLMFGFDYELGWVGRIMSNLLAEVGESLYKDEFTRIDLTGSEEAKAVAEYFYTLAAENLGVNPINPSPNWIGADFNEGIVAMIQYGYWFSAMAESEITAGQVVMLPSPTWAGVRRDPTMTATGMIMAAASEVPDAAWKVFEWYNGGEPSVGRASSGWGAPALKSQYELMPNETDFQKHVQQVLAGEMALDTPPIQFNPYLSETAFGDSWGTNLARALEGEFGFEELLANVEAEVNAAIQDGIDRIG